MKQKQFFLKIIISLLFTDVVYTSYSEQYMIALDDLIKVHKKYFPHDPIEMNDSSLVYSVYKKIITPWALNINGLAHIVQNNFYAQQPYSQDIQNVWTNFQKGQKSVNSLKKYFEGLNTTGMLDAFYKEIGADVVQIFFNIVQQCTNQLTTDQQDLESCFIAYQIACTMYQSDMQISGIQEGADFSATLAGNMVVLYQNVIKELLNQLSIGMLGSSTIEHIYDQIARYYNYLAIIGTNANNTQLVSKSQAQALQACQNYGYYLQAQKLYQQAENLLKKYPSSVVLNVNDSASTQAKLQALGQNIGKVIQLVEQSNQYYTQAQDIFGKNQSDYLYNLVNNVDLWIVQGLAQLWLLYLQDQSSQNQYTAATIGKFISAQNKNSQDPVTNDQVMTAFQNLSALIQQKSNAINALSTINVLKEYSLQEIITSLRQQIIEIVQSGTVTDKASAWMYNFASLQTMNVVENILFYLVYLSDAVVNTISGAGSNYPLQAMAYAQALDSVYKQLSATTRMQVNSLVPYFPDQLQQASGSVKATNTYTWSDWTRQILLASLTVNAEDLQDSAIAQIKIQDPSSLEKKPGQKTINSLLSLAHQNALSGNFKTASNQYQQLMSMYTTLYSINPQNTSAYENMMEAKTMYTALSFAATLQPSGNQTWGTIKDIPTEYRATRYGFNTINVANFGMSQLPASLLSLAAGTEQKVFTQQQQSDILKLIKAYAVNELLSVYNMEFSQVFVDYNLEFNTQVDQSGQALASQILAQVDIAFNKFEGVEIISINLADASTIESVICKNILLCNVNPLFASMATALTFYASAQLLVEPNTNTVKLGNASYTPGNDEQLSDIMIEKMIKVYLTAAYPHWQEAQGLMQQLSNALKSQNTTNKSFPANFENSFKTIDHHIARAQALLYAQGQSAYAYAIKNSKQQLAQSIEQLFFDIYQKYVAWMKKVLIGKDPFDTTYQIILYKINSVYVAWASLLGAQNKASQVKAINNDIVSLFTAAGQACMNISYTEPLYPNFIQYHYATAAHYFLAVQSQYTKMNEQSNALSMNNLINEAYFKGSSQNVALFSHVAKHGVVITHEDTNEQENVALSTLIAQKVFSSTAEQNAYNSVQNLLLNAGIGYSFLTKRIQTLITQSKTSKNSAITQDANAPYTQNVTTFLRNQNIMSATALQPLFFQDGVAESIFAVNMQAYNLFKNNLNDYASWLSVLYSALQALYAFNYLGATGSDTGQDIENQMTEFFTALEKHTSSLENPSSVYVG